LETNPHIQQKLLQNNKHISDVFKDLFFGDNLALLNEEIVESGIKCLPTAEEKSKLEAWITQNPGKNYETELQPPDYFHYTVLEHVEEYNQSLEILKFCLSCPKRLENVLHSYHLFSAAAENLRKSSEIQEIFQIILATSNFVNHSENGEPLSSFHVDLLTQLKNIKLKNNKTYLDYLAKYISENYPQLVNWTDNLQTINSASTISLENLENQLNNLNSESSQIRKKITQNKFESELNKYGKEIEDANRIKQKVSQEWSETAQRFGASPQKILSSHFFEIFVSFAEDFRESVANCKRENEQKEVKGVEEYKTKQQIQQEVKKELATRNQGGTNWDFLRKKDIPIKDKKKTSHIPSNLIGSLITCDDLRKFSRRK